MWTSRTSAVIRVLSLRLVEFGRLSHGGEIAALRVGIVATKDVGILA
jgi:hypothetical protein